MTIDFTCQKCDASFELDAEDLIDGTEKLVCPNCDAKATASATDDFVSALVELRAQVIALSKRFAVNMAIETEDLGAKPAASADDEDEEESDEDDEDDLDSDEDDEDGDEDVDEADDDR